MFNVDDEVMLNSSCRWYESPDHPRNTKGVIVKVYGRNMVLVSWINGEKSVQGDQNLTLLQEK